MPSQTTFGITIDEGGSITVLKKLDSAFKKVDTSSGKLDRGLNKSAKTNRSLSNEVDSLKVKYLSAGAAIAGVTAIIAGSVRQYSQFQTAISEVNTLLGAGQKIDDYSDSVRELSKQFGTSNIEQAKAFYSVISAGASDAAEATNIMTAANKLAVGGVTDIETAADGLTSVLNAYSLDASEAGKVSDILFATMRGGKTTIGELSSSLGKVAPIASQVGVGLDELNAALAVITKGGVSTNEAVTQVKAALANVLKPSKEASELAEKLGINFTVAGLKANGFAGFIQEVAKKTGGSSEQLALLFGSIEAVQAVMPLAGSKAGEFAEMVDNIKTSAGATDTAVKIMMSTLGKQTDLLTSQIQDVATSFGETLAPAALAAIKVARQLLNVLPETGIAVAAFGVTLLTLSFVPPLFAAIAAQATIAGSSIAFLGVRYTALLAGTALLTGATTALKTAFAFLGGPVGVIFIAIAAMTAWIVISKSSKQITTDLTAEVEKLNDEYFGLTKSIDQVAIAEHESEISSLQKEISGLVEWNKKWGFTSDIAAQKIEGLRERVGLLIEKKTLLQNRIIKTKKETEKLSGVIEENTIVYGANNTITSTALQHAKGLVGGISELIKKTKELTNIYGEFGSAADEVDNILFSNAKSALRLEKIQAELNKRFKAGDIDANSYKDALKAAGFETESLGDKSKTTIELMQQGWKKLQDGIQDAFFNAFRSGENFFKSLKNLAFDILAQIAAKILATFAIKAIGQLLGGTKVGTFLGIEAGSSNSEIAGALVGSLGTTTGQQAAGAVFGEAAATNISRGVQGLGGAASVAGGVNQISEGGTTNTISGLASIAGGANQIAVATTGDSLLTVLGISTAAGAAAASAAIGAVALETTALTSAALTASINATFVPAAVTAVESAAVSAANSVILGSGTGGATGSSALLGSGSGSAAGGSAGAGGAAGTGAAGTATIGAAVAAGIIGGRALSEGTGDTGKALGSLGILGGAFAQVFKALGIIGNARSPQQLGLDQLQAVDEATKAGRNQNVQLGESAGTAVSLIGGFDENSIFFGIDLIQSELQKVGDTYKRVFGADQALALKDGVLRLEDFSQDFSSNHEKIVSQVKAAIAITKISFIDAEKSKLAALGKSVIAMDRLFDQTKDSQLSVADRIQQAYMGAFNATESVATQALERIGISSERMGEIFTNTSDNVLSAMLGIGEQSQSTADIIIGSFGDARDTVAGSWEGLSLGQIAPITVPTIQTGATTQQAPAQQSAAPNQQLDSLISAIDRQNNNLELLRASGHDGLG